MTQARQTTNHEAIRRWVEKRGGTPSRVKATAKKRGDAGILRIDFPGFSGEGTLEAISWDEFFETFDRSNLAFLYQDKTSGGRTSRFAKFVERNGNGNAGRSASRRPKRTSGSTRRASTKRASAKRGTTKRSSTKRARPAAAKKGRKGSSSGKRVSRARS